MLAGSCGAPFSASAEQLPGCQPWGDADCSGKVDVADAVLVARFCAEDATATITDTGKANADVNSNKKLDSSDLQEILEYIAKKRIEFSGMQPQQPVEKLAKTVDLMEGVERSDAEGKEVDDIFVETQFDLTAKFLKQITQNAPADQEVLLSPLSLSLALGMAANGAKGETLTEIEQLLGMDVETLNKYYYDYVSHLPSKDTCKLNIANSVWIKDDENRIAVPEKFLQTNKDYYDAGVFRAPFDEGTVKDLNDWVSKKTRGMIPELVQEFDPLEVMVLVNALYFDAEWATKYKSYQVHEGDFFINEHLDFDDDETYMNPDPADKIRVEYLVMQENYYVQDENAIGFVKPYSGGNYSFVGLVPNNGVTVQEYIDRMNGKSLKKLMDSKQEKTQLVYTCLPKFQYSYEINLNDTLKALGVKTAFERYEADFTGLNKLGETWLGEVLQKTVIDVNENGTRAAAVTSAHFNGGGGLPQEAVFVYLERPFIYMIVDNRTNLPVFIGTVRHPEYK